MTGSVASMVRHTIVAATLFFLSIAASQACDIIYDPAETWEDMIDKADVVFVGRVVATEPETAAGWGRAVFEVERWVKGGSGVQFVAAQGSGSNCVIEFRVGSRVIFAGFHLATNSGTTVTIANDDGSHSTVFLSDPPTIEQFFQLDYVSRIAEPISSNTGPLVSPPEPIEEEVADFLVEMFESTWATNAAGNVRKSVCSYIEFDFGSQRIARGSQVASFQTCGVDLGCGEVVDIPVWRDVDGTMWFGPDSVETIVAVDCPEAIPDPAKRDEVVRLVEKQMGVQLQ